MTVIKGLCPDCAGYKNAQMIYEHKELQLEEDDFGSPTITAGVYRILKCGGCSKIYFQMESAAYWGEHVYPESEEHPDSIAKMKELIDQSDDDPALQMGFYEMSYWPTPKRKRPDWSKLSDSTLVNLLNSVYTALDHNLGDLAAMGMRAVFDRASQLIGIDPNLSFNKKLDQLVEAGMVHVHREPKGVSLARVQLTDILANGSPAAPSLQRHLFLSTIHPIHLV
jgi:hypothetical protein